jgi:NAD(P)H-dependent FMN reductase
MAPYRALASEGLAMSTPRNVAVLIGSLRKESFIDQGKLSSDSTREFLQKFLQAFAQWIERNAPK